MKFTFNDRVAFVTGASRGIGKEIALELAKEGCKVLCVSRKLAECRLVADEIKSMGFFAEAYECDVSNSAQVSQIADEVLQKYEKVDIVVNNAGIARDNIIALMSDEEWADVINIDLSGAFYVTRAFVPMMMSNRWGRIINISSMAAIYGTAGLANYAAAKGGMLGMTKALACELASRNICVNAVAPGLTDTDLIKNIPKAEIERIKRDCGGLATPNNIAFTCKFLASEEGGYITGQTIELCGGRKM